MVCFASLFSLLDFFKIIFFFKDLSEILSLKLTQDQIHMLSGLTYGFKLPAGDSPTSNEW